MSSHLAPHEFVNCRVCGKLFARRLKKAPRHTFKVGPKTILRRPGAVTCSPKCSRKWSYGWISNKRKWNEIHLESE